MIKIICVIPVHGREKVVRVTKPHMLAHIDHAKEYGIELSLFHYDRDERPLGRKWNNMIMLTRDRQWEYLMILGSDDLMRPYIWLYIRAAIAEGLKAFGFNTAVMYDRLTHRAKKWNYNVATFGAGRCVHRSIVEGCEWEMWDNTKGRGMDNNQEDNIYRKTKEAVHIVPTYRPLILDIKDGDNLNAFDDIEGGELDAYKVREDFPDLAKFIMMDAIVR